ncbi:hypothetical protein C8J57DRAFT_1510872 [Mycena rebaudengoi]|nr:hypothetical protein C8J57DRAFT_1510872 [Mycena rebaudengoi]
MPTSASSATTSAFPAPPLLYSDDVFYAASTAALDHFNECYGFPPAPDRPQSLEALQDQLISDVSASGLSLAHQLPSAPSNTSLLFVDNSFYPYLRNFLFCSF